MLSEVAQPAAVICPAAHVINAALSRALDMVAAWSPENGCARSSPRSALYVLAALLIGYFGVNAYSGDRGLKAKEDIDRQMAALTADLQRLKRRACAMGAAYRAA